MEKLHDFSMTFLNFHDFIFSPIFHDFSMTFHDKIFSMLSMTVGTLKLSELTFQYTEVTLFIDCNNYLQSETLLKPRDDVACDVMSRLSAPHLMKLATYALLPVKCLQ